MDDGSVSASTNDQPQRHSPAKKTVTRELALLDICDVEFTVGSISR